MVIYGEVSNLPNFQRQIINVERYSGILNNGNWKLVDSFRSAYVTWDRTTNLSTSQLENEQDFDYGEFPLERFYNLILETSQESKTTIFKQATTIGIEVNKNPFFVSGEGIESLASTSQIFNKIVLPSPYITKDFISKKNYLGLFIEHEISLSDRLSINFEGTFDVAISDTTDLPELPFVEPIENNNFYPEVSLNYELTDHVFLFTAFSYSTEKIEGIDAKNRPLNSERYQGIELGIETELGHNWLATLSFYHENQNNITTIDPNEPDFNVQINQQTNQSWTGEIRGEITPGWWVYGFYSYTNAKVIEDEVIVVGSSVAGVARHSGSLWTSYEITQGIWKGLGIGGGITWNGDRPGDTANSFSLSSYIQTDAAIFYFQDRLKAAISVQNLFNTGREDEEVAERSLLGTVLFQF